MVLYGVTLVPLSQNLREAWYADDMAIAGKASQVAQVVRLLQEQGPRRGYFPEPEKSIILCHPDTKLTLQAQLGEFNFLYRTGSGYVGGFLGTTEDTSAWVEQQIDAWIAGIRDLAKVARRYPQTAFAGLTKSLQTEWTYLQRVVPNIGEHFGRIERALADDFLPALFDNPTLTADATLREPGNNRCTQLRGLAAADFDDCARPSAI